MGVFFSFTKLFATMASVMPSAIKVEARSDRHAVFSPDKNYYGDVVEDLYHIHAGPSDRFVDCLVVSLTELPENADKHEANALSLVQGRFWKIGEHNGRPVWRQEKPEADEACNKERLFLFFDSSPSMHGWYIATSLKAKRENHAWAKADGSAEFFPRAVHCPYWRPKTNKHVAVFTSHEFHAHQLAELKVIIDSNEPPADWSKKRPRSPVKDTHGGPKAKGSFASGKAAGEPKGQSHGGWMLKAVDLSVAVLTNSWEAASDMATRYRDHPSTKALFDRKLEHGLQMGKKQKEA